MQFFFPLSGFVMTYVAESKRDMFTYSSGMQFITQRLVRLVPLYQLGMICTFIRIYYFEYDGVCRANACRPLIAWPLNAMFLQAFLPVRVCGFPTDHPSWNYMHFNAHGIAWFTACLIWISSLFPCLYNIRPRRGVFQSLAVLAIVLVCRALPELLQPSWSMWGHGPFHLYAFAPLRLFEFFAGIVAASVSSSLPQKVAECNWWGWIFDVLLLLVLFEVFVVSEYWGIGALYTGDFFSTGLWCLVFISARFAADRETPLSGIRSGGPLFLCLSWWPLVALAKYSFGVYMVHEVLLRAMPGTGFPCSVVLTWVLGAGVTMAIEEPLQKYVASKLKP